MVPVEIPVASPVLDDYDTCATSEALLLQSAEHLRVYPNVYPFSP